ncbi:alpha-glucosidase [Bryocella elongata]|uniref:Alpha-glucosidase n=1 Tax=Bryocella elongata TaxID=863522 RepID=A0A1H6A9S1_9BACT|nr:alpha-amylase family glycosyl hydrolase [Bryocella elongata]SEG44486.1 alpha-glucosidase [Bryocella elongata]
MPIFFRRELPARLNWLTLTRPLAALALGLSCAASCVPASSAQTLAHRNWAGSGMNAESWWRSAVFYRIQPTSFQDSSGDGVGDLKGIAERMSYIRSLGVDAIVLLPPFDRNDSEGLDTLLSAASQSRIRVIVGVRNDPAANPVADGRSWLARGAAGIELEADTDNANPAQVASTIAGLRSAAKSYPGERVVLASVSSAVAAQLRGQRSAGQRGAGERGAGADLLSVDIDSVARKDNSPSALATSLRQSLLAAQEVTSPPAPMLFSDDTARSAMVFAPASATHDADRSLGLNATIAAMLLTSQSSAVSLLYGQELGIESTDLDVRMQWTPTNITPASWKPEDQRAEEAAREAAAHPAPEPPKPAYDPNQYGGYVPYVPPPRKPTGPAPFDPNAQRGFSSMNTGTAASSRSAPSSTVRDPYIAASVDATRSAAVEEHDPHSLLKFYEKLIALHRGYPGLRAGTLKIFDHDAQNALVWVRLPPAGAVGALPVVVVCNLGDTPLTLSITDDLKPLHIRYYAMRRIISSPDALFESVENISMPPHAVYFGELYH